MRSNLIIFGIGMAAIILLGGCASSRVENDFGTSHKLAVINQTLNANAEKNLQPVDGIDGQSAQKILDKYHGSFEKPVPLVPVLALGAAGNAK